MPDAHEDDTPPGLRYAGFRIRLLATLIDSFLLTAILLPLLLWVYGLDYLRAAVPVSPDMTGLLVDSFRPKGVADILLSYVAPFLAVVVFGKYRSATPGKMMLGLRIVDAATAGPLTFTQCVVRTLAYAVSILPLGVGFLWIALDPRKQGFHDKLAGTLVVRDVR